MTSHGRFVNDGNRGCGNFESFYASSCKKVEKSEHDREAADSEAQKLLLFSKEDLLETIKNTRLLGQETELPYPSLLEAYRDEEMLLQSQNNSRTMADKLSLAIRPKVVTPPLYKDGGEVRAKLERAAGNGHSLNHGFVLKETKWISTISMTLLALENVV